LNKITDDLKTDIEDASAAGLLGELPAAVAEKDHHVTDVLSALAKIQVTHTAHQKERKNGDSKPATIKVGVRLVFAGGTCLSKAHRLIERMSEDIDIKVVLEDVPEGYALPNGQGDRSRLKALHIELEATLRAMGFEFVVHEDADNPIARDNRRYYCLLVSYVAQFQDVAGILRPQLKIELIHRHPLLPVETCSLGYLLDQLVSREAPYGFSMSCITVAETLAEKVLSLLRRCAWNWDGYQRGDFDTALVRHLYDVWRIIEDQPTSITPACEIFSALIQKDVEEFENQHPEFDKSPYVVLRRTLSVMASNEGLRTNFDQRLKPLLYAVDKPDFDTCYATFLNVATQLLDHAEQATP
jgi:predicted nucleotidyltransferase component of viral defense system